MRNLKRISELQAARRRKLAGYCLTFGAGGVFGAAFCLGVFKILILKS